MGGMGRQAKSCAAVKMGIWGEVKKQWKGKSKKHPPVMAGGLY